MFAQKMGIYTVPAGKRLVIEYVDSTFYMSSLTIAAKAFLRLRVGSLLHSIGTSSEPVPCSLVQACVAIAKQVRIYADPGATIDVLASGFASAPLTFASDFLSLTLSGHLVDL